MKSKFCKIYVSFLVSPPALRVCVQYANFQREWITKEGLEIERGRRRQTESKKKITESHTFSSSHGVCKKKGATENIWGQIGDAGKKDLSSPGLNLWMKYLLNAEFDSIYCFCELDSAQAFIHWPLSLHLLIFSSSVLSETKAHLASDLWPWVMKRRRWSSNYSSSYSKTKN